MLSIQNHSLIHIHAVFFIRPVLSFWSLTSVQRFKCVNKVWKPDLNLLQFHHISGTTEGFITSEQEENHARQQRLG